MMDSCCVVRLCDEYWKKRERTKTFIHSKGKTCGFYHFLHFIIFFVTSTVFMHNFMVKSLSSHLCCIVLLQTYQQCACLLKWVPVYIICMVYVLDSEGCQTNQISYWLYWLPPAVENSIGGFQWYWWVAHPCHYACRATWHDFPCFPCQRTFFLSLSPHFSAFHLWVFDGPWLFLLLRSCQSHSLPFSL